MAPQRVRGLARTLLLFPMGAAVLSAALIGSWLVGAREPLVALRLPKPEPELVETKAGTPQNPGTLIAGEGKPSTLEGSWPQFRGSDHANVARGVRLTRTWPAAGLPELWRVHLGEGYAGPAVHRGRVYLIDYDQEKKEDAIRCLSLDDGAEIWRYTYSVKVKRNHGMSRTVPAVTDQFVVAMGPKCHVHCLDATTGKLVWKLDLKKDFGTQVPPWYAGQCPFIDGDAVILAPGGKPLMMAVELASGKIRWRTPNPGGWGMTHVSVAAIDADGGRQYVYCTTKGVVGVAAGDGRLLWKKLDWRIGLATVPTPVVIGSDHLFLSGGYKAGCTLIRITRNGDQFGTEEVFRLDYKDFDSPQQTPVLYDGHIYGVSTLGRDDARSQLACLSLEGKRLWESGASKVFGLGPYLIADGLLLVLHGTKGTLHLIEALPSGFKPLANAQVLDGHECWGPMALAGNRLLARNLTEMVCLELPRAEP